MIMLVEIRRNELDQLLYTAPLDIAYDTKSNLYVVFRSYEKCTFLRINSKQELADRKTLNFSNTIFSKNNLTSVIFDKKLYDLENGKDELCLIVGFKTGCICKLNIEDQQHMGYWNVNKFNTGPISKMICQKLVLVEELNIILAHFDLLVIEYEYELIREGRDEDYEIIYNMNDSDLFIASKPYNKLAQIIAKSGYNSGFVKTPDRPELGYCWVKFKDKPYLNRDNEISRQHKMISVWRFNIGHITDIRVYYCYEEAKGGIGFLGSIPMDKDRLQPGDPDVYDKVKDVYACITANDGYFRVFSLVKNCFVCVCHYLDGGINNISLSYDRSMCVFSLQNDSIILLDIKQQKGVLFDLHDSFVSHAAFFNKLNAVLRQKDDPDWDKLFRVMSASLDGSVSILDFRKGIFLNHSQDKLTRNPNVCEPTVAVKGKNDVNMAQDKKEEVIIEVLSMDNLVVGSINPKNYSDNKNLFFKKKIIKTFDYGISGAILKQDCFGLNSPTGVINIFYMKTSSDLQKSIMNSKT